MNNLKERIKNLSPDQKELLKEKFKSEGVDIKEYYDVFEESSFSKIEAVEVREYYPVSSAQKRLLLLDQIKVDNINYNMPGAIKIKGNLNKDLLLDVFKQLVNRYESLRTSFEFLEGNPVQKIHDYKELDFEVAVIKAKEGEEKEIIKGFIRPFNLNKAPLIRVGLIEKLDDEYILLLDMHHIISDGVSINILLKEITELYQRKELKELEVQYKDFAIWQNELFKSSDMDKQRKYWLDRFQDEIPVLDLPTDYPRPKVQKFEGDRIDFELSEDSIKSLKNICKETNTTLYMVLLAVFNVLLSKYSGQEDIIIGSPITGRNHADLENIVGMFVNTLAIRNYPKGEKNFIEFLDEVRENTLNAYENQDYQFEELVDELKLRRDLSRNPLFDVMFAMQNMDNQKIELENLQFEDYSIDFDISKFDMTLYAKEEDNKIKCQFEYATKLFKKDTIESFIKRFVKAVEEVASRRDIKLSEIEIITEEEKEEILYKFNDTKVDCIVNKTLNELFEEQVEKTPYNVALVFGEEHLTYKELNERANQLARVLKEKGVKEEAIVGIMVERSLEMIIGIIAILKAGGAYLPIDPAYPENRINYMLSDSGSNTLLTQNKFKNMFKYNGEVIDLEDELIYQGDSSNLKKVSTVNNLAYVIYTSGSTGKPKGVMIEHKSVINTLLYLQREYPLKENDAYLLKTNYVFDVSVTELVGFIFGGSKLVILERDLEKDPVKIMEKIEKEKITHINFTPSMLKVFIDELNNKDKAKVNSLKYIFSAGEDLKNKVAKEMNLLFDNVQCENLYGPTEASIYATRYSLKQIKNEMRVPIGKPLSNTEALIIDRNNKLQPIGIAGELCIIGNGLARGYLNREELTKEKFGDNPFGEGRMYKTGDLARWLPDGNIEFLGRIDHQVKIRGYRIELGDIESQLLNYEDIKEVAVLAKEESGNQYLIAYVASEKKLSVTELKKYLSNALPDYMVPSYFVQLDKMPLNKNGKIDRKALPESDSKMDIGEEYVEATNEIELKLSNLWKEMLKVDSVGIKDNFFNLGGHSLKVIELVSKIHREFNVELEIRKVFELKTIKNIAQEIKEIEGSVYSKIEPVEEREYYPVSSAQKRLLLLDQIEEDNINYNMPGAIKIKGNLNKDLLLDVFKKLVNRHESLRTSFEFIEGGPIQKIHNYNELDFKIEVIKAKEGEEEIIKGFTRPFDLNKAPLIRVGLIEKSDEEYTLLLDMHHIISDGVSINILLKEITEVYQRKELKELEVQYKDFAIWQNELFKSSDMDKQRKYWLDRFQDEIPVLDLPIDYPRPKVQKFEGDRIDFELSEDSIKSLKNICKETNTTLYMVLLSIYTILLSKYSGQEDIIIGSPIAGRKHIDLENIIGMFVNTLAIRNYPKGEKNFIEFLDEVRENTLNAYENQDYQFEELVDELELRRDISRNPLFDVMFTMQNMGNQKIELENLELKEYSVDFDISKFDMTLYAREEGSKIKLQLEYATKLLKRETIERFVNHFLRVVEQVSNKKNIKLSEIEIITEEEKKKMLYEFNDTEVYYPKNRTIHGLFEEQAERIPNNIAVVFGDKKLTYKELNERSNQLARVLKEKGVKEGTIVGIMVEHSLEMVIGIVAILKAGGAYLPIDITYPVNRINYMLDDSGVTIVLLTENLNYLIKHNIDSIYLDKKESYLEDCSNIANINKSSDLAYIIYTSGTTGKPKGVMIPHNNVVRLLINDKIQFDFSSKDTWTMFHSFCFDFSVWEMYGALLYGGKLVIISKDIARSPKEFLNLLKEQKVTVLNQTPSAFYNLINEELDSRDLKLRYIIFGGEALKPGKLKRWNNKYPEVKLINMYGITETTVHVTYKEITEDEINSNISNIGRPIPTLSAYVMDEYLNLLPTGVIGELYISGEGVAKGYLNKKELTDERFIDNPFGKGKMYKTGDLARWLPNGELEYMGRKDFQVEIRGHRVELGEIESKLLKHNDVKDVVLQAKEEKEGTYLIAYLVSSKEISIMDLRKYLSEFLPEYMVPAYFIFIDEIPLTKNGKVDKKALPELDGNIKTGEKYIAPRNQIEEKLLETWVEVLKVNNIGVKDNYFSLGGDSIKAIRLISNINKKLDMSLRILDLYKNPTVEDLAYYLQNNNLIDNLESVEKIVSMIKETKDEIIKEISQDEINNIEDVYPMSDIEKGMVFYSLKNGYDGTYHDQFAYNFNYTSFDNSVLSKALELMVRKHPMLRTSFYTTDGIEDVQVVYKEVDINIREENITKLNSKEQKEYISKYCEESRKIPFDVKRAPLWRMTVFILNKDYITLVWEFHHSILDGWSNASFIEELNTTYLELKKDNNYKLDRLKSNYKDFIVGQLVAKQNQKTYAYWKKELKDYKRFSFNSASVEDDVVYNHHYNFDKEYLKRLDKISNDYGTTLKSICLAAYVYTLKMFSYESDITIGVVTNNRPLSEDGDRILGCFLNTVPFRTIIEKNITWGEYIKLIDDKLLELKGYEQLSLFEIVQAIGEKPVGVNPIFDVVFNFVDFHVYKNIDINNMEIIGYEKTNTLLDFTVNHTFNSLYLNLNYSRKLVGKDDIEKLVNYFKNFIDEIINNMESKVDNYKLLLKDEIDKVLYKFNDTKTNYPGKTINELFEEQAEKTPDNVAVVFERAHLTYKELNEKTNQLARILREKGVHEGTIVGILVKRSLEMIIGIMAILKSGGTYLPVDPNYPIKRINYMLDDSGAEIILVTENLSELVKDREKLIYLDDKKLYSGDSTNLVTINKPNDLAYIIYTSGSTGKPKGTMIEHRNVIRLFKNTNYIEIKSSDGVLQLANYVFDGSIFDIFAPLLNGSKLVLIKEKDMLNMNNLGEIIKNEEVTVFFVTTALFNTIVDTNIEMLENIRKILFGGERISISHANKAVRYLGKDKIIHVYGPTENTVFTTYYYINKVFSEDSNIPIGRPLSNSTACVVDKNGNLLPAGVIGELYVGGEGIARGYLNNEKLTGDKFIKNPFGEGRLYKTGDLVKQLPDGNIEYLDRIDNQVKIRGFRIELGDIENKLLSHKDIKKAIVIAKQNKDDKYLVSYIVSDKKININEIKEYLSKDLPKFMIPSYFIQLDEFPLNQNGKINRKILPEPDIKMEKEYIEPQSEVEKRLAKLLKEVLGVKKIGINDSFFELGGHSLKATELVSKIQREFNVNLEIMKILELENIKNIAKLIEEKINSIGEIIDKIDSDELEDLLDDIENIPIE